MSKKTTGIPDFDRIAPLINFLNEHDIHYKLFGNIGHIQFSVEIEGIKTLDIAVDILPDGQSEIYLGSFIPAMVWRDMDSDLLDSVQQVIAQHVNDCASGTYGPAVDIMIRSTQVKGEGKLAEYKQVFHNRVLSYLHAGGYIEVRDTTEKIVNVWVRSQKKE